METWTVASSVARGVAWLDRVAPNWRDRVDAVTLDMASPTHCVAGQVFAAEAVAGRTDGYSIMVRSLPEYDDDWGGRTIDTWYGFTHEDSNIYHPVDQPHGFNQEHIRAELRKLRAEWLRHIRDPLRATHSA
jgi:hypothetical protein